MNIIFILPEFWLPWLAVVHAIFNHLGFTAKIIINCIDRSSVGCLVPGMPTLDIANKQASCSSMSLQCSAVQNVFNNGCFMKQNCYLQRGTAKYRNTVILLSSKGIYVTHLHFQKWYMTFFVLKGLKSSKLSKFEYSNFLIKWTMHFYFGWQIFSPLRKNKEMCLSLKGANKWHECLWSSVIWQQFYSMLCLSENNSFPS